MPTPIAAGIRRKHTQERRYERVNFWAARRQKGVINAEAQRFQNPAVRRHQPLLQVDNVAGHQVGAAHQDLLCTSRGPDPRLLQAACGHMLTEAVKGLLESVEKGPKTEQCP